MNPHAPALPTIAQHLCERLQAPPRLVAHLQFVHQAAQKLVEMLKKEFPTLSVYESAVLFGAATHDLGKTLHPEEISASGKLHQQDGPDLLVSLGVDPALARFALTHSQWEDNMPIEDYLVAIADKIWKRRRVPELEALIVARIAGQTGMPPWQVYRRLDDILHQIAQGSDERIAHQRSLK